MSEPLKSASADFSAASVRRPSIAPPNSAVRKSPQGIYIFPDSMEVAEGSVAGSELGIFDEVRSRIEGQTDIKLSDIAKDYKHILNGLDMVRLATGDAQPDCVFKYATLSDNPEEKDKKDAQEQEEKKVYYRKNFLDKLLREGFIFEQERDKLDPSQNFIKVFATFELLLRQAELDNWRMRLANVEPMERKRKRTDFLGEWFGNVKLLDILFGGRKPRYASAIFTIDRYEEFMGSDIPPISMARVGAGDGDPSKEETFFSPAMRANLIHSIVSRIGVEPWENAQGKPCLIGELLQRGAFTKYYFVHDGEFNQPPDSCVRAYLFRNWVMRAGRQPLDIVRDYMGEKIALYYAWLGFYTTWLFFAAFVGVLVFLYGLGAAGGSDQKFDFELVFDNALSAPFALFMSIWSTLFLEYWKRENARLKVRWSVHDFEENEPLRPGFVHTKQQKSPVTGEMEEVFPRSQRIVKLATSTVAVLLSIALLCTIVFAITVFRPWARNRYPTGSAVPSVLTALLSLALIRLASMSYVKLAEWLTEWENHRTDTEYEDALILKRYLFEFVNYYSSLFYVAIIKQWAGRRMLGNPELNDICGFNGSCLSDLMVQLAIIFVGNQLSGQIMEVGIPYFKVKWQKKQKAKAQQERLEKWQKSVGAEGGTVIPQYIEDDLLEPAGAVFDEYSEMVIQFGFCSLFVAAFPLAPMFAFLNNVTEIHTDAYKMITQSQRPPGLRAQDLGSWEVILTFVSKISVITNALVIALASKQTRVILGNAFGWEDEAEHRPTLGSQLAFVLIFEHVVFLIKMLVEYLVPDVPETVKNIIERDQYLEEKRRDAKARARPKALTQASLEVSQSAAEPADVVVE